MKIMTWNVLGLNDTGKRRVVKKVIKKLDPNVLLLKETKISQVTWGFIGSLGFRHRDWVMLEFRGGSGGILVVWKSRFFEVDSVIGQFSVSMKIKGRMINFVGCRTFMGQNLGCRGRNFGPKLWICIVFAIQYVVLVGILT